MNMEVANLKGALRAVVRAKLAALSPAERAQASASLCARLRESELWSNAKSVLMFSPLGDEPDIWPLVREALAAGKTVALPRFSAAASRYAAAQVTDLEKDLVLARFQIREPNEACPVHSASTFDLILVPGVAFDHAGRRLGRGRGFYDRLLESAAKVSLCGIAFDEQQLEEIPAAAHDVAMNYLVTPQGLIRCPR